MSAKQAFDKEQATVLSLLSEVTDAVQAKTQANPSWGAVGDMEALKSDLTHLRDRLKGLGEYAEVG